MTDISMENVMETTMEDIDHLDHFSGYNSAGSTATTADHDDLTGAWSSWSPVVDWTSLTAGHEDFHHLIDSMILPDPDEDHSSDDLYSNTDSPPPPEPETETSGDDGASKGVRLVHLLVAAAEAIGDGASRDLARVILVRLKELVSGGGSTIERLAAHFTEALHSVLDSNDAAAAAAGSPSEAAAALQLLQDTSPYVKFGHFTANQAILEATAHNRRIHVVDFDIMEGVQWAPLIHALASRDNNSNNAAVPHLRITAVARGGAPRTVAETGRRLSAFAAAAGLPFSFQQCRLDSEALRPSAVRTARGEALVVNCTLGLPHSAHRSPASVASFLSSAAELGPRLVALVEEEEDPPGAWPVGRFAEALHRYSAVYDSLEAGFPVESRARAVVERVFMGPRIAAAVGRIYRKEEGEGMRWGEWLRAAGFRETPVSSANVCQAKLLLGLFNDGYRVEEVLPNRLVLGWKSRRLLGASLWSPPPPSPSPSSSFSSDSDL